MRNWTINEAVAVINEGTDMDAIKEIAKHFPVFFMAVAKNDVASLASMMPEKFTVRRLQMDAAVAADTDDEDVEATSADVEEAGDDADLSAMSTKELMKLCDKRGIKVPHYGKNKQFYLDALQNAGDAEDTEDEAEAEESENPYEGKSAMELYKMCKSRKIKAEQKKPAKYYIGLLTKADEAEAEDAAEESDDDWGDEEAEAPAKEEKKAAKKAPAKKAAKAAKKEEPAEEAEDDDDEWDI